ncbi:hypothetical protein [Pseudomonas sp. Marseille-QA0892]
MDLPVPPAETVPDFIVVPMTERELLMIISRAVQHEDVPEFSPARTGALLFDTMIAEWERLSVDGRNSLTLVLGMMAKELTAEAKAERTTAQIIERMQRAN